MPDFKILAAAFPTHCFCLGNHHCSVSRHGIWQPFFCLYAKQNNDMKNQTSGALIAPEPAGVHVSENLKALNEQVNNLQSRYYRSLAPDCELHGSSDRWYFGAILKKKSLKICRFRKNRHLCSDFHFEQAERFANFAVGIFYAHGLLSSSVPCGALMRPLPVQGGSQRGAELFCSLPVIINILFHFK